MKYFYILLALVFLASCGAKAPAETKVEPKAEDAAMEQTINEVEEELLDLLEDDDAEAETAENPEESMEKEDAMMEKDDVMEETTEAPAEEEAMESKVVKLSAPYTNPAGEVDMAIEYSLDSEGKIEAISVSATTYDLTDFNTSAQKVIGMTVEDAANEVITGGSLTDPAFSAALKNVR